MKKRDHQSPYSPPAQAPQQSHGDVDQARAMFERMKGEVIRQSERERAFSRSRGLVVRLLLALTIATCLLAAATMIYGIYNFPDAPIRQTDGGYLGKGGKHHTQDDFEAFILWRNVMFIIIPSVFGLGLAFGIIDSIQRRKRMAAGAR